MPQETISLFCSSLNNRKLRGQKAAEGLGRIELHPVPAPGGDVIGIAPLALVPLDRFSRAAELDDRRPESPAFGVRPEVGSPLAIYILLDLVVSPNKARAARRRFSQDELDGLARRALPLPGREGQAGVRRLGLRGLGGGDGACAVVMLCEHHQGTFVINGHPYGVVVFVGALLDDNGAGVAAAHPVVKGGLRRRPLAVHEQETVACDSVDGDLLNRGPTSAYVPVVLEIIGEFSGSFA